MATISQITIGVIIAIVTSITTVTLSFARFKKEKLWERTADAYSALIEALLAYILAIRQHIDDMDTDGEGGVLRNINFPDAQKKAMLEIHRAVYVGGFLMHQSVQDLAHQYLNKREEVLAEEGGYWGAKEDLTLTENFLRDLTKVAQEDIKYHSWFLR